MEIVLANRERDLHTLALLDLDPTGMGEGEQSPMSPEVAINVLRKMASVLEIDVEDWTIVLCSDMGTENARISVGPPAEISDVKSGRIHCLIVPAKLHDVEAAALQRWD